MERKLRDIRYFASNEPNETGGRHPGDCSDFFNFPKKLNYWGRRISQKIGADSLSLGSFDHLYINFTSVLSVDEICLSDRVSEDWFRYVDFGVNFESLNKLNEQEMEAFLIESTFRSLLHLCGGVSAKQAIIEAVKTEVSRLGSEVELPVKMKETKSYSVIITYKLHPNDQPSYGLVKYTNLKSGQSFQQKFVELKYADDVFSLVGSIAVKSGKIIIKPRSSFNANLHAKNYSVPIEIEVMEKL